MYLTLERIDTSRLGLDIKQTRYIIHIASDVPVSLRTIELQAEHLGKNEELGWKNISRNPVNPCEVILTVESSRNFRNKAETRVGSWLETMVDLALEG